MAKFLCIYREATERRTKPSPEEMQAAQTAWYAWMQKFSASILPGGDGLKRSGRILKAGLVTDGPYAEAKDVIGGYFVIEARDAAEAEAIAKDCPHLAISPANWAEIRPIEDMSQVRAAAG